MEDAATLHNTSHALVDGTRLAAVLPSLYS